jgi:hypothetical protein
MAAKMSVQRTYRIVVVMNDMSVDGLFFEFWCMSVRLGVGSVVTLKVADGQFGLFLTDVFIAEVHFRSSNNRPIRLTLWICRVERSEELPVKPACNDSSYLVLQKRFVEAANNK